MFVEIDQIIVDVNAVAAIAHTCNPASCTAAPGCCQRFEVCIDRKEMKRIIGFLPLAAEFSNHLRKGASFRNVFEEVEPGLLAIDKTKGNQCVFAYPGAKKEVLCSLHSAALKTGKPPEKVKPTVCTLWPLALTDEAPRYLSVCDEAFSFPCNGKREVSSQHFHPEIEDIIRKVFGEKFLEKLLEALDLRPEMNEASP